MTGLEQVGIAVFGVAAIWLSQDARWKFRRWACISGLCAQPFWFYTTAIHGQWVIFALSLFYSWGWLKGVRTYWWNPDTPAQGADTPPATEVLLVSSRQDEQKPDSSDAAPRVEESCRKCGAQMQPGKAMGQTYHLADEGTCSPSGPGYLTDCMKCSACGWSVTKKGE